MKYLAKDSSSKNIYMYSSLPKIREKAGIYIGCNPILVGKLNGNIFSIEPPFTEIPDNTVFKKCLLECLKADWRESVKPLNYSGVIEIK